MIALALIGYLLTVLSTRLDWRKGRRWRHPSESGSGVKSMCLLRKLVEEEKQAWRFWDVTSYDMSLLIYSQSSPSIARQERRLADFAACGRTWIFSIRQGNKRMKMTDPQKIPTFEPLYLVFLALLYFIFGPSLQTPHTQSSNFGPPSLRSDSGTEGVGTPSDSLGSSLEGFTPWDSVFINSKIV